MRSRYNNSRDRLSALDNDCFNTVAECCEAIDLARLSLCSKALLTACEASAAMMCRRRFAGVGLGQQHPSYINERSWRYRYLMASETASVDNPKLRCVLSELYNDQPNAAMKLNLYGLNMGDDGVCHLALALRAARNVKLSTINLGANGISDQGVRALLKGVESHLSEISTLSLAKNLISSAGTEVLGQLVARSQNLRNLCISENPITDEGALLMGSVIKQSNLASLSMRSLSCSAHARESIRSSWGARGWLGLYL